MIRYGGFSAIGQTHLNIGLPNQDSFGIYRSKKRKKELVLVISDGIGSHKHSDIGSMAIVKAVTKNAHLLYDRSNKNNFIKKYYLTYPPQNRVLSSITIRSKSSLYAILINVEIIKISICYQRIMY